ncbi:MAG: glycosyltransferase family 4 protein [Anaerolineae bacterium]
MRICLVNLDYVPYRSSGLAVYGETLALGLAAAGHDVTVVASQRPGLPATERIGPVQVYRTPLGRADWISFAWGAGPLVTRLHNAQPFDVVHFLDVHFAYHYHRPFVASTFQSFHQRATSDGGLPYHSNVRGLFGRLVYYHGARWLLEGPAVRRAEHLIAASQATAQEFRAFYGADAQRTTVVPLGIDLGRFRPLDAHSRRAELGLLRMPVLLYAGFCTPRKGLDILAQALHRIDPRARLLILGRWEPSYRARFYRELGPEAERVLELGYVADEELPLYYNLADLFVFPSLLEGFGIPLAEALACGTPVVATTAGSMPEVVGPGGRIVPPRDPEALAEAINALLADPTERERLGTAGREWVLARFAQERMVQDTLAVYEKVLRSA